MAKEKSAGVIIVNHKKEYLLLHYPSSPPRSPKDYWDLVKGHIEEGETELEAAKREAKEETGLDNLKIVNGFRKTINYSFKADGEVVYKTVVYFLARTAETEVTLSEEHTDYKWATFRRALLTLTYDEAKNLIRKAHYFLED